MKKITLLLVASIVLFSCKENKDVKTTNTIVKSTSDEKKDNTKFPQTIKIEAIAQNPEGIEFNKKDNTFLLSSLNATPILKVSLDGTYKPFTSGEPYPMSTAGLQIDYKNNRLLATGFNGTELFDQDPKTKGVSNLRIYNLASGVMEKDINLSSLIPDANAYFANDIAMDDKGNAYVSDWYAGVVYKVDIDGNPSVFWRNETGIPSGPNGLDFHSDGYLLVSILTVNDKGLYANYGLVNIPLNDPKTAKIVDITNAGFTGFDGMVLNTKGNIVGVTNNGTSPGGNTLIELSSNDNWESAKIVNSKTISASTTVAVTPNNKNYIINQDFTKPMKEDWTIEQIKF